MRGEPGDKRKTAAKNVSVKTKDERAMRRERRKVRGESGDTGKTAAKNVQRQGESRKGNAKEREK
ncbi:MAG: hypothetical protein ACLR23_27550 [Clostridia bacterium]